MFSRQIRFAAVVFVILALFSVQDSALAAPWRMIHGEVLLVFPQQSKLLLASDGVKCIFELEPDCDILRCGCPVALDSARPIAPGVFQDALCWINKQGKIGHMLVNYSVEEAQGVLVNRDIFGNMK